MSSLDKVYQIFLDAMKARRQAFELDAIEFKARDGSLPCEFVTLSL